MAKPTVTIIVPTFNRAKYLLECLNSLLAQTYEPSQIIIVNDGSTNAVLDGVSGIIIPDSTPEAIGEGILKFAESRSRFSRRRIRSFAERFRRSSLVAEMRTHMIAGLERGVEP